MDSKTGDEWNFSAMSLFGDIQTLTGEVPEACDLDEPGLSRVLNQVIFRGCF